MRTVSLHQKIDKMYLRYFFVSKIHFGGVHGVHFRGTQNVFKIAFLVSKIAFFVSKIDFLISKIHFGGGPRGTFWGYRKIEKR